MKSKVIRNTLFAVIAALSPWAYAAEMEAPAISGMWSGQVELPNGNMLPFIAHLGYNGREVIGFLAGIGGPDVAVLNGSLEDNTVRFYSVRPIGGEDVVFQYVGELDGDTMHFDIQRVDGQGAPLESTTRRIEVD